MVGAGGWLRTLRRIAPGAEKRRLAAEDEAARLCNAGDAGAATEFCAAALLDWPASGRLNYLMGECFFRQGQYAAAAERFLAAKNHSQEFPLVLYAELNHALALCRTEAGSALALPLQQPAAIPFVSIIICSIDDRKFESVTAAYESLFAAVPHEIIRIADARSLTEGYNRGMDRSRGELLIFSHDDVRPVNPDFALRVISHLEHCDLLGVAGTSFLSGAAWVMAGWPFLAGQVGMDQTGGGISVTAYAPANGMRTSGIQALDGLFLAVRRDVATRHRFDADTFDGWHMYDLDFSFRVAEAGHAVAVANDLLVVHNSKGEYRSEAWRRYEQRFLAKFENRLAARGNTTAVELCAVSVNSEGEWLRLAAARLAASGAAPRNPAPS